MAFESDGNLTTDKKSGDSFGWDTQTEWEAFQSKQDININSGVLELAQSTVIIDDFEDGDIAEYSGETGAATVTQSTTTAQNGDYYVEVNAGGTANTIASFEGDGLNAYPDQGETFRFWTQLRGSVRSHTNYGRQTVGSGDNDSRDGDGYQVVLHDTNTFSLAVNGYFGGTTLAEDTSVTVNTNEWYEIEVVWGTDDSHTVTLYDSSGTQLTQLSATDSTYTNGGIALSADNNNDSADVWWDYYRVV